MLDLHDLSTWLLAGITGLAGWVKNELEKRPTRDELILRLENMETKIDNIKEDVEDIKHNQQRIDDSD